MAPSRTATTTRDDSRLVMEGVTKSFGAVKVLRSVNLSVGRGEVLALVGENGAGKSTLIKILSGSYHADEGAVRPFGEEVAHPTPASMMERGIGVVHQELSLARHLTVAENVFLGRLPRRTGGFVDWALTNRRTQALLDRLAVTISPTAKVADLSIAEQQMVEIAKALSREVQVLVLDEPSAVLGERELERLFRVVQTLASEGVAIVYISHRLVEVFLLADTVAVLRDGANVITAPVAEFTPDSLVSYMVGRPIEDLYPPRDREIGEVTLEAQGLRTSVLKGVDLTVRDGEIVGIAGLAGSGRTEVLRAISGADRTDAGVVKLRGQTLRTDSPRAALREGVGLVPEDRKNQALFLDQSAQFNINITRLSELATRGVISPRKDDTSARIYIDRFRIRTQSPKTRVRNLSGGNQQKCVLARYASSSSTVMLVDEPTRGVDVGAKQEIYALLDELARGGTAILIVSSELPEVLGLCDRVLVMKEGSLVADFPGVGLTEEDIMRAATGQEPLLTESLPED